MSDNSTIQNPATARWAIIASICVALGGGYSYVASYFASLEDRAISRVREARMAASSATVREHRPEPPRKPLYTDLGDHDRLDPNEYRQRAAEALARTIETREAIEQAVLSLAGTTLGTICQQDPAAYFQHRDTGTGAGIWYIYWGPSRANSLRLDGLHRLAAEPLRAHLDRMMILKQRDQFLLSETGMCGK